MDQDFVYIEPTVSDILEDCVGPSVYGITIKIFYLIICNLTFCTVIYNFVLHETTYHLLSTVLGILLICNVIETSSFHFLVFLLCAYIFVCLFHRTRLKKFVNLEYIVKIACIAYILFCEFFYPNQDEWMQTRGMFMIAAMKIISLSSDLYAGLYVNMSLVSFFGYLCSPANSLFGPWIPYKEYELSRSILKKMRISQFVTIIKLLIISIFFLSISNCWGTFFIDDDNYKWIVAYRQALSFRTSHYFVSYLSEAGMVAAGYSDDKNKAKNSFGYEITKPFDIEAPSSLVSVVVTWNIPIHRFLKKYVYRPSLKFGHFKAIFTTFLVSSLLHGFNIELATVLLTIGIYSYVQLKFQEKLSMEFNACLGVRPCKSCYHKYKRNSYYVKCAHLAFGLLTVFNLIFLGILMDYSSVENENVYTKWANLDFLSIWVMFAIYIYTNL